MKTLLIHQWKCFWRARGVNGDIILKLLIGFVWLYMSGIALGLGYFLEEIVKHLFPNKELVSLVCGVLFYYFFIDFIFRLLFQGLPTLIVQPYLIVNIQRSKILHFLNIRSLTSIYNFIPLFLFIPFSLQNIKIQYGIFGSMAFITLIISLTLFNNFLTLFLKRKALVKNRYYLFLYSILFLLLATEYFNLFSWALVSSYITLLILKHPYACLIVILLPYVVYRLNFNFLLQLLYLSYENFESDIYKKMIFDKILLFSNDKVGALLDLEIKLIIRNKRPYTLAIIALFLIFYGFIFFQKKYIDNSEFAIPLLAAILLTASFSLNYGLLLFSWNSNFFDGLMCKKMELHTFIRSKFKLLNIASSFTFLISLLFSFLDYRIAFILLAGYLFNIGVNTVLIIFFGTFNRKSVDLTKGSFLNYEGVNGMQSIYSIVVLLLPYLIYYSASLVLSNWSAIFLIGAFGLVNIFCQKWWVNILVKKFTKDKYALLGAFRNR